MTNAILLGGAGRGSLRHMLSILLTVNVSWTGLIASAGDVPVNASMANIARTLTAMENSTVSAPAHLRVMFWGQSIVAQGWDRFVREEFRRRYPTVVFDDWSNRAIGGWEAQSLYRTSESDLYPFYPDILFFHVYGDMDRYEEIVRETRRRTTADIVLWTSHLRTDESPEKMLAERNERSRRILEIADKYGCAVVDLNRKWSEWILRDKVVPTNILRDVIHMRDQTLPIYAKFLSEEIVPVPGAKPDESKVGTVTGIPWDDPRVKKLPDGSVELAFDGNRVVAVSDSRASCCANILLDGRPVNSYRESWYATRPGKGPIWMPLIKTAGFETVPAEELWTLTFLPGSAPDGSLVHFRVEGSVTGPDGEGWSTNDFRSVSGRVTLKAVDWCNNLYQRFKDGRRFAVGDSIRWRTLPIVEDPFRPHGEGTRTTLVQGCPNGPHVLRLQADDRGGSLGRLRFIVHKPADAK